jgi:hypothetical protein
MAKAGGGAAVTADEVAIALRVLARAAEDRGVLAVVDAETRAALQKLAGEVGRPDVQQRRKLRKALGRAERDERKVADVALRQQTGIQQLRQAPVFVTPLPVLPRPGTDASGWWPQLGGGEGVSAQPALGPRGASPPSAERGPPSPRPSPPLRGGEGGPLPAAASPAFSTPTPTPTPTQGSSRHISSAPQRPARARREAPPQAPALASCHRARHPSVCAQAV